MMVAFAEVALEATFLTHSTEIAAQYAFVKAEA
jgi:hypothetical protein